MTPESSALLGLLFSPILFAASAYFTRATLRRVGGALVGGIVFGIANVLWDILAFQAGWWRYPASSTALGPVGWYIAAGLWFGAGVGLIGWRVIRRFDTPGLVGFLIAFGILGVIRDYRVAIATQLLVFAPGVAPMIADALGW